MLSITWASATSAQVPPTLKPTTSPQSERTGVEHLGNIEVAPIKLDGQTLFKVASPTVLNGDEQVDQIPVEVRANRIEENLNRIIGNNAIRLSSSYRIETSTAYDLETLKVYVGRLNNTTTIFARDDTHPLPFPLLTVTQSDAEYWGMPIDQVATFMQEKVEQHLHQALEERTTIHLSLQIFKAVLVTLGILIGSVVLCLFGKLLRQRDKLLKVQQANEAKETSAISSQLLDENDPALQRLNALQRQKYQSTLERQRSLISLLNWFLIWAYLILWIGGILFIFSLFPWTKPLVWIILSLPIKLLGICFVIGLINLLIDALLNMLEKAWNGHQIVGSEDEQRKSLRLTTTINVLKDSKMVAIYLIAVIWGISVLGAPVASILAASGLLVVALSFSFQNLVKDLITGFLILWEDQFAIGDTIAIQNLSDHLVSGLVENMNLRITQLRDLKGCLITIPNSTITQVQNMTRGWSQVDFSIEIAHGADIDQAIAVIQNATQQMFVEEDWSDSMVTLPHVLGIDSISQSGLVIRVLLRTKPAQQWKVEREFRRRVLVALSEQSIAIV
ncbi:MAG: mechanosensitive ion channel family protein [Oscillatoriales cyanobacterium C42_A2020_001]|nr:mechanosensitive ion channel family protein [Leptolyngbyaceae cyanobacterium C42_A2020_001]